jgi:hypothetical protein
VAAYQKYNKAQAKPQSSLMTSNPDMLDDYEKIEISKLRNILQNDI